MNYMGCIWYYILNKLGSNFFNKEYIGLHILDVSMYGQPATLNQLYGEHQHIGLLN